MSGTCAKALFVILLIITASSAFSIISYNTDAAVQHDGSLRIHETMSFDLEKVYNEGYRSIRSQDFGSLSDITVNSVTVNGQPVPYALQMNGDHAEIVWKKTYAGNNLVELDYTIKDRVQLYDDFAKVCYEHYGADWPAAAQKFRSSMTMPSGAAGKDMHFEVYSAKKGNAYISGLSVIVEMDDVPSGNYIGGCYLFDKGAVQTGNKVSGSALAILNNEREAYGSQSILGPTEETDYAGCCCLPAFLISLVTGLAFFLNERKRPKLPESILPPEKEEPAIVSTLVRNECQQKELVASTIIDLINRNVIDIVELEKAGEKGEEIKRERTILMLKKRPAGLKDYENSVLDLIFSDGNQVDLDAKMAQYDAIKSKADAQASPLYQAVKKFNTDFPKQIDALFTDPEIKGLKNAKVSRTGVGGFAIFLGFIFVIASCAVLMNSFDYLSSGKLLQFAVVVITFPLTYALAIYSLYTYWNTTALPKKNIEKYGKWDAFYRGLKSSRIKEYPPASAVIWGDILVYATALGLADKVKSHLSELSSLDPKIASRMDSMDRVALRTMTYYSSAVALHNLATVGNRSGFSGGHGGFSSHSSGGWSSGGGGGFSGGSSGGGGFR